MRFWMTFSGDDTTPPTPAKLAALHKFGEDMQQAGILIDSGGILPPSKGARLRLDGDKFTVTDGPFPEIKELILGYAIVEVKDRAQAIEVAHQFMAVAGDGEGEIRQLFGPADGPPPR